MTELIGGIAPVAGSLTLFVADGRAASTWRGAEEAGDPIGAFHAALGAGGPAHAPVAIGTHGSGWFVQLGSRPRDASVFRLADDRFAVVGPYWERADDEDFDAAHASEIRRLVSESGGERVGTLGVPSGRLLVAHAWGDLTGAPLKASSFIPPEERADFERLSAERVKRRGLLLRNVSEFQKRLAALSGDERKAAVKLVESTLEWSAEGACGHIEIFGGTSAVIRRDTGDLMLVVPIGTYALSLRDVHLDDETLELLELRRVQA